MQVADKVICIIYLLRKMGCPVIHLSATEQDVVRGFEKLPPGTAADALTDPPCHSNVKPNVRA